MTHLGVVKAVRALIPGVVLALVGALMLTSSPASANTVVAVDDSFTTNDYTPLTILTEELLANDQADGESILAYSVVTGDGTIRYDDDSVVFTPSGTTCGPDVTSSFSYQTTHPINTPPPMATVTITIQCFEVVDDEYEMDEGETLEITPMENDTSVVPQTSLYSYTQPNNGGALRRSAGDPNAIIYHPDTGCFDALPLPSFVDQASYTVGTRDGVVTGTIEITVNCSRVGPVAEDDSFELVGNEGATQFNVLSNDEDGDNPDGQLRLLNVVDPAYGELSYEQDGDITFTPDCDAAGGEEHTALDGAYRVIDPTDDRIRDSGRLVILVHCNEAPVVTVEDAIIIAGTVDAEVSFEASDEEQSIAVLVVTDDTLPEFCAVGQPVDDDINQVTVNTIACTTTSGDVGSYDLEVVAVDGSNASNDLASDTFTLTVVPGVPANQSPSLAPVSDQVLIAGGLPLELALEATDVDGDDVTLSVENKPDFCDLSASTEDNGVWRAVMTCTVAVGGAQGGQYDLVAVASDGTDSSEASFSLTLVQPANESPVLSAIGDQTAVAGGDPITIGLHATDDQPDSVTFAIQSSLPNVDAFCSVSDSTVDGNGDATAVLTCDPGTAGVGHYLVSVAATDGTETDTVSFTLTLVVEASLADGSQECQAEARAGGVYLSWNAEAGQNVRRDFAVSDAGIIDAGRWVGTFPGLSVFLPGEVLANESYAVVSSSSQAKVYTPCVGSTDDGDMDECVRSTVVGGQRLTLLPGGSFDGQVHVRRDGSWVGQVNAREAFVDPNGTRFSSYVLRYRIRGEVFDVPCSAPDDDVSSCQVTVTAAGAILSWLPLPGQDTYQVRRAAAGETETVWLRSVVAANTWIDPDGDDGSRYEIIAWPQGMRVVLACD